MKKPTVAPLRKLLFRIEPGPPPPASIEPDEAKILAYLRRCEKFAIATPARNDPYRDEFTGKPIPVPGAWRTDGAWAWPDRTIHYVRTYHLPLPADFLAHGRRLSWRVHPVADERMATIIDKLWP